MNWCSNPDGMRGGGLDRSLGPVGVANGLGGTHEDVGVPGLIQEPFRIRSWDEARALGKATF